MNRISKVLEGILAQVVFDTMRSGAGHRLKDHLFLAILRHGGTYANNILREEFDDWQMYLLTRQLELDIDNAIGTEWQRPEQFYLRYLHHLLSAPEKREISTLDVMVDILSDPTTASHALFNANGS